MRCIIVVVGKGKRKGALSSQANDNWTNGLLLSANDKQQMANRRRRRSAKTVVKDKDRALVGGWH